MTRQRQKIYGDFTKLAKTSKQLKKLILGNVDDEVIEEALEMILHKVARVANNPCYIDNYRDIAGYCHLIVDYLENESKEAIDSKVIYKKKGLTGEWRYIND